MWGMEGARKGLGIGRHRLCFLFFLFFLFFPREGENKALSSQTNFSCGEPSPHEKSTAGRASGVQSSFERGGPRARDGPRSLCMQVFGLRPSAEPVLHPGLLFPHLNLDSNALKS